MSRPKPTSQAGRILHLLESANGGKVSLLEILNLRISQYSARIHGLRHKYGFRIENGSEPGHPERTWFRLEGTSVPIGAKVGLRHESVPIGHDSKLGPAPSLFPSIHSDLG